LARLRSRLVELYDSAINVETRLFPGFEELLREVEQAAIPWGVVTNKLAFLTEKLLAAQGLRGRARCVVAGDTVPEQKPHPAPLLHAAKLLQVAPGDCLYVGDSERDIQAGRAAGMATVAALYGYISEDDDPRRWNADGTIAHPSELRPWLDLPR
jgi:N-acetyl-D-muramate 6-phosphate phosphatase